MEIWERDRFERYEQQYRPSYEAGSLQAGGSSWSGRRSAMYAAQLVPFEKLAREDDRDLRHVGELGEAHFSKLRDLSLMAEKRAAVRGEAC